MSYYCKSCKRYVERKTKTGIGFWLFAFFLWMPSLVFVAVLMSTAGMGIISVDYSIMSKENALIIFVVGGIWVLSPFIIYYRGIDKCPICNTPVEKVSRRL